ARVGAADPDGVPLADRDGRRALRDVRTDLPARSVAPTVDGAIGKDRARMTSAEREVRHGTLLEAHRSRDATRRGGPVSELPLVVDAPAPERPEARMLLRPDAPAGR